MAAQRQQRGADRRRADLARIHIARKWATQTLGMTEGDYRALIAETAEGIGERLPDGKESSANLSADGRLALLVAFIRLGWPEASRREKEAMPAAAPTPVQRVKGRTNGRYPVAGNNRPGGMLSQRQADYIAHLEDILDWTDDPNRLTGWIARQLDRKLSFVAALTKHETTVVITGLEVLAGIKRSGSKAHRGARWGKAAETTTTQDAA